MRVWVARAEPAAARTAGRLRELGHDPLVAPVVSLVPTDTPAPLQLFDAILLTSANAIAPLARAAVQPAPIFAVGRRTAEQAREAGLGPVIAADGDAGSLAISLQGRIAAPARLLHVAGENRKAEPAASLRAAGYDLTTWVAYAARPVDALPANATAALRDGTLCAVLHYSRRSAAIALALTDAAGLGGAFRSLRHLCLSMDVALPLVETGIPAHFVPARPDEEALLAGLAGLP